MEATEEMLKELEIENSEEFDINHQKNPHHQWQWQLG